MKMQERYYTTRTTKYHQHIALKFIFLYESNKSSPHLLIPGTTFSGFAYAKCSDTGVGGAIATEVNISEIYTISEGYPGHEKVGLFYPKTSTSLFYRSEDDADPFWGWNARFAWEQTKGQQPWQYQHRFKLRLAGVADDEIPPLPPGKSAEQVIADYLRQLSKFAMTILKERNLTDLSTKDVRWCLTIPAQWTEAGCISMMQACSLAGMIRLPGQIDNGGSEFPLMFVFEPEAASVFCFNRVANVAAAQRVFVGVDI